MSLVRSDAGRRSVRLLGGGGACLEAREGEARPRLQRAADGGAGGHGGVGGAAGRRDQ